MATYGKHYGYTRVRRKKQKYSQLERTIDFSKLPVTSGGIRGGAGLTTAWAAKDVLEVIGIRAGQTVLHVECEVLKRDAADPAVITIGDGDNDSRWGSVQVGASATTLNKKAEAADQTGVEFFSAAKSYRTADTIDVRLGDALTTARIKVTAHILEDDR